MILTVDIGNTRAKAGLFQNNQLVFSGIYTYEEFPSGLLNDLKSMDYADKVKYLGWVSVGRVSLYQLASLKALVPNEQHVIRIEKDTPLPIVNGYGTPETLGMDRIVAAAGALDQIGHGPCLIIDAGTALTYEIVDGQGTYAGGAIAPGMRLRYKALNDHTAQLPLVEPAENAPMRGDSTETSIRSGVQNGLIAELEGMIQRYRELYGPELQVFLTGGDAEFLGNHLKNINFVDANLLLKGINAIVRHNYS